MSQSVGHDIVGQQVDLEVKAVLGLRRYRCKIDYFDKKPLDDLSAVVCTVLRANGGKIKRKELGLILGFSMVNQVTSDHRQTLYYDSAEVALFEDMLRLVEANRLIVVSDQDIILTALGKISLKKNTQYRFYRKAYVYVYEHHTLKSPDGDTLEKSPFRQELGIQTEIIGGEPFWPSDNQIPSIIYGKPTSLAYEAQALLSDPKCIYKIEKERYYEKVNHPIMVMLQGEGAALYPMIVSGGHVAEKTTALLHQSINEAYRSQLVRLCLFNRFWADRNSVFDYAALSSYFDLVDFEALVKDARTLWTDSRLFDKIAACATPGCWSIITHRCNLGVLYSHLDKIKEQIDWPIFTKRVDSDFLSKNFGRYPWDLEVLSTDNKRDNCVIERLVLEQKISIENWNWSSLRARLSDEFILSNLSILDVDLSDFTVDTESIREAILVNPHKRWDWKRVEGEFDLQFILDHIAQIGCFLSFKTLFNRIFVDSEWASRFLGNAAFRAEVAVATQSRRQLATSLFNDARYVWSDEMIAFFEQNGLIVWQSTPYQEGFGKQLSLQIHDMDFVMGHLMYAWDWPSVMSRFLTVRNRNNRCFMDNLAARLSSIPDPDVQRNAWTALMMQYPLTELKVLIEQTDGNPAYKWDKGSLIWHPQFDLLRDLDNCRDYIDWDKLSVSPIAEALFEKLRTKENFQLWRKAIASLLCEPANKWNFKLLSSLEVLRNNTWFVSLFKNQIDWDEVSKKSRIFCWKDREKLDAFLQLHKEYINFGLLLNRRDVDVKWIIKVCPQKDIDFNVFMEHGLIEVTQKLIEDNPGYPWDWRMVSRQTTLIPTVGFLLKLIDNKKICEQIDWYALSSSDRFPITKELMERIPEEKLNWKYLSGRSEILTLIDRFKSYLDWTVVCGRDNFVFTESFLEKYETWLDWRAASASEHLLFTETLVNRFKERWYWHVLLKNKAFYNRVDISKMPYVRNMNVAKFINQFPTTPKAYHFTHMSNAIKIIKSMKLKSRERAKGCFENSAGSNVDRTTKAHSFARFYFTAHSPTQFYNEFLGKDIDDKYYSAACELGLPRCPMPVFFVFDIEEMLNSFPDKCYYSNGNMQKDSSCCFKVIEAPEKIKAKEIYMKSYDTFQERQQEFLVKDEVDFSHLKNVYICCFDEYHKELLTKELAGSPWAEAVRVSPHLYINQNKGLRFIESDNKLIIETEYLGQFEFRISYLHKAPTILDKTNVCRQKGRNIYMKSRVEMAKDAPFEVFFEVNVPETASWLIFNNSDYNG